jgi:SAM-dependent methyltransferase
VGSGADYGQGFWEGLWSRTLRERSEQVARRPPSERLTGAAGELAPGRALDAGCGHGAEAIWLAARGWEVTAVDFSPTALERGRKMAEAAGPEVAERVEWVEADLGVWAPEPGGYDLVFSLYVHIAGAVEEAVERLAAGVGPGGILLLVGHNPIDPTTGAATPAAGQVQVSVETATAALDSPDWKLSVAEDRPRAAQGTGTDAVILARRLP